MARRVHDLQPAAYVQRRGRHDTPVLKHRELRGSTANVDIEDTLTGVVGDARRPRAESCKHCFHVMAGGRADEIATVMRYDVGDSARVLAPQRLAGQDHRSGVHIIRLNVGGGVGLIYDPAERRLVDHVAVGIRREGNGRLVDLLSRRHGVAARELLAEPAHLYARKDHLRAG